MAKKKRYLNYNVSRADLIDSGYYDGRYRRRIVKNKKKKIIKYKYVEEE